MTTMVDKEHEKVNQIWKYAAIGGLSVAATLFTGWVSFGRTATTRTDVESMISDKLAHPFAVVEALTKKYQSDLESINQRLRNIELQQKEDSTKLEIMMNRIPARDKRNQ
jgi:hypothetical protein